MNDCFPSNSFVSPPFFHPYSLTLAAFVATRAGSDFVDAVYFDSCVQFDENDGHRFLKQILSALGLTFDMWDDDNVVVLPLYDPSWYYIGDFVDGHYNYPINTSTAMPLIKLLLRWRYSCPRHVHIICS